MGAVPLAVGEYVVALAALGAALAAAAVLTALPPAPDLHVARLLDEGKALNVTVPVGMLECRDGQLRVAGRTWPAKCRVTLVVKGIVRIVKWPNGTVLVAPS